MLGSKAYCAQHEEELKEVVLGINIDMIGCIMGKLCSVCTAEQRLCDYLSYLGDEIGIPISPKQEIHSSDSTPFQVSNPAMMISSHPVNIAAPPKSGVDLP